MNQADNKQDIIRYIDFDRSGFGSLKTTLKEAREKDNTITMADVQYFFRKSRAEKTIKR